MATASTSSTAADEDSFDDTYQNSSPRDPYSSYEDSDYIPSDNPELVQTDQAEEQPEASSRGRKRKRNKNKQKKNQELRNSGKTYRSYRGKGRKMQEKKQGPNCNCKQECFQVVSLEDRLCIFTEFWKLSERDVQNAYLFGCLKSEEVKRKTKKDLHSRRNFTIEYSVMVSGQKKKVCKKAFLSIHGLQDNRGRIENIAAKISGGSKTPTRDKRGCHKNHKRKYTADQVYAVQSFIEKLPKYESHYSRNDNPDRMFMTMEYTIESCYEAYVGDCSENDDRPVSLDKFRRVFTEEFNIRFKSPKTDSCSFCDSTNISIQEAKKQNDTAKLRKLTTDLELHQKKAKAGQDGITRATKEVQENKGVYAITFDLQQALPTPKLSTGPTFYKKKLFCYNFSIHCLHPRQGYFYMWDESTAGRGADEIGSCLLKHFESNNIKGEKLIAISDNCSGQNKNWSLISVWVRIIALGYFKHVTHFFPVVGHTMLPSDRDFAMVEKYVRTHCQFIYDPKCWEEVLRNAQKKTPFKVHRMTQQDFKQVSKLRGYFHQPTAATFSIRNAVKLEFSVEDLSTLHASTSYSGELMPVSLKKRGRPTALPFEMPFTEDLPSKYNAPLGIENSKLEHVLSCLQWIPQAYHPFFNDLKPKEN